MCRRMHHLPAVADLTCETLWLGWQPLLTLLSSELPCTISPRPAAGTLARCATAFNVKQVWFSGACWQLLRSVPTAPAGLLPAQQPQFRTELLLLLSMQLPRKSAWWARPPTVDLPVTSSHGSMSCVQLLQLFSLDFHSKFLRRSAWWAPASSTHLGPTDPASTSTSATTPRWRSA